MKIVQILESYEKGTGVGNAMDAIDEYLKKNKYETLIYKRRLEYEDVESEVFGKDTIVFYHFSLILDPIVKYLKCKKVMIFHNITPPEFVEGVDETARVLTSAGWYDALKTADYFDAAITFSEYSKKCLVDAGWESGKISVLPIMLRVNRFEAEPSKDIIKKYRGDAVNILFAGRIWPNKKQEDVIAAFSAYKEVYQKKAKLFLVGSTDKMNYYPSLVAYARRLGLGDDVVFTGHVAFSEYLAYYHIADLFLCMSAHEGFCIPLAEAMYFGIPILAHASTAVPDTLRGSGVLLYDREPWTVAGVMNKVMTDHAYRREIIKGQNDRLKELLPQTLESRYDEVLKSIINEFNVGDAGGVSDIKGDDKYQFKLSRGLALRIELMIGKHGKYVVYGAGFAGAILYAQLRRGCSKANLVICDTYKAGEYDEELNCHIIFPKEAVVSYAGETFIVSIQNQSIRFEVALYLMEQGIKKGQILFYDMVQNDVMAITDCGR